MNRLGPKYCIFFQTVWLRKKKIKVKKDIKKIFVSFGGSDPADFTNEFIGNSSMNIHTLLNPLKTLLFILVLLIYRDKISKLIDKSDLKITLLEM